MTMSSFHDAISKLIIENENENDTTWKALKLTKTEKELAEVITFYIPIPDTLWSVLLTRIIPLGTEIIFAFFEGYWRLRNQGLPKEKNPFLRGIAGIGACKAWKQAFKEERSQVTSMLELSRAQPDLTPVEEHIEALVALAIFKQDYLPHLEKLKTKRDELALSDWLQDATVLKILKALSNSSGMSTFPLLGDLLISFIGALNLQAALLKLRPLTETQTTACAEAMTRSDNIIQTINAISTDPKLALLLTHTKESNDDTPTRSGFLALLT